ncbi:DUF3010 family protein [Pseudomonas capeferrum]|uniref:DUF3010 family protein n=1 Tax=Pseudomonas capeferrum TaxID=1495066 RepID=UPI0015E3D6A4|nr:DUF3010 family protein [Pseudomonas capeferrum]MBA1201618.1 DUF3010 family protein [Pseudomonas capeferrum]
MNICGIEIKGSELMLAVVTLEEGLPRHVLPAIKKLGLEDDEDAGQVKAFARQIQALVREHHIDKVAIKKRGKKGEFAGGPVTFKLEGILQLLEGCEVQLLSPQTLGAQVRKHAIEPPASLHKYQHEAYKSACALLFKGR